jgi:hypothetical protein
MIRYLQHDGCRRPGSGGEERPWRQGPAINLVGSQDVCLTTVHVSVRPDGGLFARGQPPPWWAYCIFSVVTLSKESLTSGSCVAVGKPGWLAESGPAAQGVRIERAHFVAGRSGSTTTWRRTHRSPGCSTRPADARQEWACGAISLRRHCPDQVLGVASQLLRRRLLSHSAARPVPRTVRTVQLPLTPRRHVKAVQGR